MDLDSGRLIFPGGKKELKPFKKEMKKLRSTWVSEMSRRYSRGGQIFKLADLADALIDTYISAGTAATRSLFSAWIAARSRHTPWWWRPHKS